MTLSTLGVSGRAFRSFRGLVLPALAGIGMNYLILGSFLLGLNLVMIHEASLWVGFVLIAAVPPAVAVIPFTYFLNGDSHLSLLGMMGAYLAALVLMPTIMLGLIGPGFVSSGKLITIMLELILVPVIISRILLWAGVSSHIDRIKGPITNWSFFLVSYTIVGLNRELILGQPFFLLPVAIIAVASTFLLGWGIEAVGKLFHLPSEKVISLVLLGTLKNYGLAGGLALALFGKTTSVPATVSSVFMIIYIIWLEFKARRGHSAGSQGA